MTSILDQVQFEDSNPEPRCAVVLLIDTSASMDGDPIQEVNKGLRNFEQALKDDNLASLRVEAAVVTFGGVVQARDVRGGDSAIPFDADQAFVTVDQFVAPSLTASGDTPMGEAMRRALALIRERKDQYKERGQDYFRPWIFLLTDAFPTDNGWETAAEQARREEEKKGVLIFPVGVRGADMEKLARFSVRKPLTLETTNFREFFQWASASVSAVAQSRPGEQVALPPPDQWAVVDV